MKIYLEILPKIGKKVGIHFYKNILSEINLHSNNLSKERDHLCYKRNELTDHPPSPICLRNIERHLNETYFK